MFKYSFYPLWCLNISSISYLFILLAHQLLLTHALLVIFKFLHQFWRFFIISSLWYSQFSIALTVSVFSLSQLFLISTHFTAYNNSPNYGQLIIIWTVASLLSCLHELRQENQRLEERINALTSRRDNLLAINARLSLPFSPPNNTHRSTSTPHRVDNISPEHSAANRHSNRSPRVNNSFPLDLYSRVGWPELYEIFVKLHFTLDQINFNFRQNWYG